MGWEGEIGILQQSYAHNIFYGWLVSLNLTNCWAINKTAWVTNHCTHSYRGLQICMFTKMCSTSQSAEGKEVRLCFTKHLRTSTPFVILNSWYKTYTEMETTWTGITTREPNKKARSVRTGGSFVPEEKIWMAWVIDRQWIMRNRLAGEMKRDVGNVWEPNGRSPGLWGSLFRIFVLQIRRTTVWCKQQNKPIFFNMFDKPI